MNKSLLKAVLSSILVLGHFLILTIVFVYSLSGFTFSELTTTVAILLPVTSVYTSAVIREIIRDREGQEPVKGTYSISFALISLLLPLAFIVYLCGIVILKSFNLGIENFDQFKTLLVTGETIFAAYVGQVVHSMFDARTASARPLRRGPASPKSGKETS